MTFKTMNVTDHCDCLLRALTRQLLLAMDLLTLPVRAAQSGLLSKSAKATTQSTYSSDQMINQQIQKARLASYQFFCELDDPFHSSTWLRLRRIILQEGQRVILVQTLPAQSVAPVVKATLCLLVGHLLRRETYLSCL